MNENVRLNNAERRIIPIPGDAKEVIKGNLQHLADGVLMPLPEKAYEYLDHALLTLKPNGGHIHYYDFEHAKKTRIQSKKSRKQFLGNCESSMFSARAEISDSKIVRTVGPNGYQVVLDMRVPK